MQNNKPSLDPFQIVYHYKKNDETDSTKLKD